MNERHLLPAAIAGLLLMLPLGICYADPYVGATVGSATLDDDFDGFGFDSSTVAFRIMAGWRFNDVFAVEFGYQDFGDFDENVDVLGTLVPASVSANGFTLGLAGALPVSDSFALTGRAGMFFWNGTASLNDVTQASPDDTNPYVAVGARYRLNDRFAAIAEFSHYELEDTSSDVVSIGVEVSF